MLFTSTIFIFLFLPMVIFLYYTIFRNKYLKNIFLLIISLIFYAWGEPKFSIILMMSIVINYLFGDIIGRLDNSNNKSKIFLFIGIFLNLFILFIFKYLNFLVTVVNVYGDYDFKVPKVLLPIGISFFTFQGLSYLIDVYRNKKIVQKNPLELGLYIAFFPQLIAGPIVRYTEIDRQIKDRRENFQYISLGLCRFIIGLSKKILISNSMAVIADNAFSKIYLGLSISFAWLGAIAYTLQIYYDFSGYSDMAIGLALIFGFLLPENFKYPYVSKSISEFWRRWHISLGSWFRDYIYFPLGGSRVLSYDKLIYNLFTVWILTGLWHGANWTFILWGGFYFVLITIEKITGFTKKIEEKYSYINHIYAMLAIILGWVLFRANTIGDAFKYIGYMFGINNDGVVDQITFMYIRENIIFLVLAIAFSMPIVEIINVKLRRYKKIKGSLGVLYSISVMMIFLICITYSIKGTYNPFIYFNF